MRPTSAQGDPTPSAHKQQSLGPQPTFAQKQRTLGPQPTFAQTSQSQNPAQQAQQVQ